MQLVPTPLPATLTLLLVSEARVSALVRPAFGLDTSEQTEETAVDDDGDGDGSGGGSGSGSNSRNERGGKRAVRVRYDLDNARSLLEQFGWVLDKWDVIPAARKEMVEVRELGAVFGAGAMVFNCVEGGLRELARLYEEEALVKGAMKRAEGGEMDKSRDAVMWKRHDVRGDLWEMMRGLKDLATAVWCVMTILESPSDVDAATSRENLRAAVARILGKENELSREIKRLYPEPVIALDRLEQVDTTSISVLDGSSIGQDTPRTSIDYGPGPLSGSGTIVFIDDSDDSDSEDGLLTPTSSEFPVPDIFIEGRLATLSDISSFDDVLVPVAEASDPATAKSNSVIPELTSLEPSHRDSASLKVITVSTTGVDISSLPDDFAPSSLHQPKANTALSAETIFQLPEITDRIVLDFFHRALEVSRFATQISSRNTQAGSAEHQTSRQKLENLSPLQMRELSTDLYDELVRRNVEDQNKGKRSLAERKRFVEPEGLDVKRLHARGKLAKLSDAQMAKCIALVLRELERRCQVWQNEWRNAFHSAVTETYFKGSARLSAVRGDHWSLEEAEAAPEGQPGMSEPAIWRGT